VKRRDVIAGGGAALIAATSPAYAQSQPLDALVAAAKTEGAITIDGPPNDQARQGLINGFQRAYGIPVSYVSSGSSSSSARRITGSRAGSTVLGT